QAMQASQDHESAPYRILSLMDQFTLPASYASFYPGEEGEQAAANLQQFQQQLAAADSKNEIAAILQQQARQTVNIPESANLQKLKTDIIANLQNHQDNITSQIEVFRAQKSSLLLKQCLKWNLGASIASILFFMIWKSTKWARLMIVREYTVTSNSN
ncbi:MAG: hypothetical protein RLZZ69_3093, partial [Cyanobacteriota bacterium]